MYGSMHVHTNYLKTLETSLPISLSMSVETDDPVNNVIKIKHMP